MSRSRSTAVALLIVLGVLDLVGTVLMPQVKGSAKPPAGAVVVSAVIGVLTLAAAYGLQRGARWSRPTIYVTRVLDIISGLLGVTDHPNATLVAGGVIAIVLSVAVLGILIRSRHAEWAPRTELA